MSVLVERDKDTGVAVVTLNRPERLNAVDLEAASQLSSVWRELMFRSMPSWRPSHLNIRCPASQCSAIHPACCCFMYGRTRWSRALSRVTSKRRHIALAYQLL